MIKTATDVLAFWFDPENTEYLFAKSEEFDHKIHSEFYDTWEAACNGLLFDWRKTLEGRLAEIIVLDQFSRNLMRDNELAFSQDSMALVLSQELISQPGFANQLSSQEKQFAYMPFMHSESKAIHVIALDLFESLGNKESLEYEIMHKRIIDRFGRYPHRNLVLGRQSTDEELAFLQEPNSSF